MGTKIVKQPKKQLTLHRKRAFLRAFAKLGHVAESAKAAGVTRECVYTWFHKDKKFRERWEECELMVAERIEKEAYRRGVEGVEEPVYQGGKEVGTITRYSDRLLQMLLRGHMKDKYTERKEIAGDPRAPIRVTVRAEDLSDDQLATIAAGDVSEYPLLIEDGTDDEEV